MENYITFMKSSNNYLNDVVLDVFTAIPTQFLFFFLYLYDTSINSDYKNCSVK